MTRRVVIGRPLPVLVPTAFVRIGPRPLGSNVPRRCGDVRRGQLRCAFSRRSRA